MTTWINPRWPFPICQDQLKFCISLKRITKIQQSGGLTLWNFN